MEEGELTRILHSNNAVAFSNAAVAASDTFLTVQAGQGDRFPSVTASDEDSFYLTIEDRALGLMEIVLCTARVTDSLTIVRAQQGTTARAFNTGVSVSNRVTAGFLNSFDDSIEDAVDIANAAAIAAATALSAAQNALTIANAAQADADAALSLVNQASIDSADALTKANEALDTANAVYSVANEALTTAQSAVNKADAAVATANAASTTANAAFVLADTALQPLDVGTAAFHPQEFFVYRTEYDAWKLIVTGQINDLTLRVAALEDGVTPPPDGDGIVLEAGILEDGIVE